MDWWSGDYTWRRKLTVTIVSPHDVTTGHSVKFTCSGAISSEVYGKCLANGDDLRVLYWDSGWTELDRDLVTFTSGGIELWFKLQADIAVSDDNYYIYYGNAGAGSPPADKENVYYLWEDFVSESIATLEAAGWTKVITASGDPPVFAIESDELSIDNHDSGYGSQVNFMKALGISDYVLEIRAMNKDEDGGYTPGPGMRVRATSFDPATIDGHQAYFCPRDGFWSLDYNWGYQAFSKNVWYDIKINALDDDVTFFIDDVQKTTKVSSYPTGGIGTQQRDVHAHYDWIKVRMLVEIAPGIVPSDPEEYSAPAVSVGYSFVMLA